MTHSFVIVTMNRATELDRLLRSIFSQTAPPDEILVIDGGTDASFDAVYRTLTDARVKRLRVEPGLSAQRNKGLSEAIGDIVTFVDDDAVLSPEYCARVLEAFGSDSGTVAIGGVNAAARFPGILQRTLRKLLLVQTGAGRNRFRASGFPDLGFLPTQTTEVEVLASTALSVRRSACEGLRFEEHWLSGRPFNWPTGRCFGEDVWFTAQLGRRGGMCVLPGAVFHHEASPRNRESTFVTQTLYVFALRWISSRTARGPSGRIARLWALFGQCCINLTQSLLYFDSGYIRGYLRAMTTKNY